VAIREKKIQWKWDIEKEKESDDIKDDEGLTRVFQDDPKPKRIIFCIDYSLSMALDLNPQTKQFDIKNGKLKAVRACLENLFEKNVDNEDEVGFLAFNHVVPYTHFDKAMKVGETNEYSASALVETAEVLIHKMDSETRVKLKTSLETLNAVGGTAFRKALEYVLEKFQAKAFTLRASGGPSTDDFVIALTDGADGNSHLIDGDVSDYAPKAEAATEEKLKAAFKAKNIKTYVIGVGKELSKKPTGAPQAQAPEVFLKSAAEAGGGQYFGCSAEEAPIKKAFEDLWTAVVPPEVVIEDVEG